MRRTNTFAVRPLSAEDEQLLRELLDASASLWNELTYERRQNFFDSESVWETADYRKRTRRRDHAQDALVRDLMERLYDESVATVYVGNLTDVLSEHWSAEVNEKTHQFWAYRSFIDRLATTAEEYGITVEVESEAYTTAKCPVCGERDDTDRDGDVFWCSCGYEGHADLDASRTFLERQAGENTVGSMARPVRLTWDDHNWSELSYSPERARPNEERTNRSTGDGKLASVGTA